MTNMVIDRDTNMWIIQKCEFIWTMMRAYDKTKHTKTK